MAKTFFKRNSPEVIEDVKNLSIDDFVKKYIELTFSNTEILTKAYNELKPKPVPEVLPAKKVTFKVIQTDNKVIPISTPIENKPENPVSSTETCQPCVVEAVEPDKLEEEDFEEEDQILTEDELRELEMLEAANTVDMNNLHKKPEGKRKVGRQPLDNAKERDERIIELLSLGKKGKDIIQIMSKEGFKVHAPQITAIKQKLEDEEEK